MTHPALPHELVRSAERLTVTTEVVPVGRAVLRVETVTEQVMVPVTVTRQLARLEHLDPGPGTSGAPSATVGVGAVGPWVVLTADEPVVSTRAVPVERVRLVTEWVPGQQDVTVALAHEEITDEITSDVTDPR